jgi:hypothetical protein
MQTFGLLTATKEKKVVRVFWSVHVFVKRHSAQLLGMMDQHWLQSGPAHVPQFTGTSSAIHSTGGI